MTPKDFTNHSGGAQGSDMYWDRIGRKYGFENHKHWRPEDVDVLSVPTKQQLITDIRNAAKGLGRPVMFKGIELVYRNWLQVHHSEANIYAVAPIVLPGRIGPRGFVNNTGKQIVDGGTGWAVEMAIQKQGNVHVFDTITNQWCIWEEGEFRASGLPPILTPLYAGIGTRAITAQGMEAIHHVYNRTLISFQKSTDGKDTNGE
jgi:hypothetical protein